MKKSISLFMLLVAFLFCMTGCKIELPEVAAENAGSSFEMSGETGSSDGSFSSGESAGSSEDASASDNTAEGSASIGESSNAPSSQAGGSQSKETSSQKKAGSPSSAPSAGNKQPSPESSGKDQYQTDPVPEGKPKPVEPEDATVDKKKAYTCTLSIDCKTILDNMGQFNKDKIGVLPKDGMIMAPRQVTFYEGESVFDVLLRETKKNRIHMEFVATPIYNSNYIEGIHNLYEFDCGDGSGWMYKVNGWFPNYGCSRYPLKQGDVIEWKYTCDFGSDLGGRIQGQYS